MYILSFPFQVGESSSTQQGNQPATGLPAITGAHNVGDTVTADVTNIADADGLTNVAYSYQWLSGDRELTGETGSSYTLASTDFGQAVAVRVTFTDDAGNQETLTSEGIYPVMTARENTPAAGLPTINGIPQVEETLTASTSGIADQDGLDDVSYAYQWAADDVAITGADAATLTLTSSEQGKAITVRITFTDDAGNEESLTSAATATVAARPNSPAAGLPTISGAPQVEETLTASASGITDQDGLDDVSYAYQWAADGAAITGADAATLTLTSNEQGKAITVNVTFTDDAGNEESLTSAATDAVAPAPTRPL